jgi:hypothetical protein
MDTPTGESPLKASDMDEYIEEKLITKDSIDESTDESVAETPIEEPEKVVSPFPTLSNPTPLGMGKQFWPEGTPSPAMSYEMIPRNNTVRPTTEKKEIVIDPIFYTILDHCLELLDTKMEKEKISSKNICKVFSHVVRYIHNIINIKRISDETSFNEFLSELISGEYLETVRKNAEKISGEYPQDMILNGPVGEYLFPSEKRNLNDYREINYIIACVEFLCCQILYSFKDRSNSDIERLISKLTVNK